MTSLEEPSSSSRRMSTSQTLSSGLHVQAELLNEIATLRSALAQSNQQLERAHAAGYMSSSSGRLTPASAAASSSQSRRDRRVTMPAQASPGLNNNSGRRSSNSSNSKHSSTATSTSKQHPSMSISTSAAQRHRRNSSAVVAAAGSSSPSSSSSDGSRATNNVQSTPRSASVVGYTGAAPSSLATPTSASVPSFTLRRDTAYDDLARVMNTASPGMQPRTSSLNAVPNTNGLGIGITPPPHRRSTSMNSSSTSNSGTPTSTNKTTMPAFPPGMVGTATTLAGGSNSPKTPLSANDKMTFDGTPVRAPKQANHNKEDGNALSNGVLRDSTNGAVRNIHSADPSPLEEEDDKLSTLHLPPMPTMNGQNVPPAMRSPHLSSDGEGEYSPTTTMESLEDEGPRIPTRRQSKSSNGAARGGSSPFFGGSAGFTERHAARIASSQSGTSKVIMSLQTDLTNARTQLEHTRTQLRASARAVESLTRQIEDLKEGKERSRLELQGMTTTLTRRERMLEETLTRARTAEGNLKLLEDEKKAHYGECSKKTKDLEGRCREAEERRAKAESEYGALRSASSNLAGEFAKEVKALKKELHSARLKSEQDRNEARARQTSVTKLISTRTSVQEDVTTALQDLTSWKQAMQYQYQTTIETLSAQYVQSQRDNEALTKRTQEVLDEVRQYKNAMRAYDGGLAASQS